MVSKSNRYMFPSFDFSYECGENSLNSSRNDRSFISSLGVQLVFSQTQPVHLQLAGGLVLSAHCLESILLVPSCKPTSCTRGFKQEHFSINIRFVNHRLCNGGGLFAIRYVSLKWTLVVHLVKNSQLQQTY